MEDASFNGYIYKSITPQFNKVKRSHYGNGSEFKQEFSENGGNNCLYQQKDIVLSNVLIF